MVRKITAALATVSALAASYSAAEMRIIELPQDGEDLCNAEAWQDYIGQPYDSVPEAMIASVERLRLIYPDTMVTMDYRMDRLNIYLNTEDIITQVRCG